MRHARVLGMIDGTRARLVTPPLVLCPTDAVRRLVHSETPHIPTRVQTFAVTGRWSRSIPPHGLASEKRSICPPTSQSSCCSAAGGPTRTRTRWSERWSSRTPTLPWC